MPQRTGRLPSGWASASGNAFGTGSFKTALAAYTRRTQYQEVLAAGGSRFELAGQLCGDAPDTGKDEDRQAEREGVQDEGGESLKVVLLRCGIFQFFR
ncbi:TPA: hypothetical protein ND458_003579 [Klebsiella pneumoniae]|nr:hypothetical protein [Klebsiella pneumoniae]HDS5377225.1 hypothetical protein [Klebsiella pneumoniae subsp. pneumoniae]HCB1320544.1 hypothetical protein [Klebsiella pneumoniae]HCD7557832.1 hypothetical protein [Klebsiella pneumoniae]HCD7871280.1 hypothetical protein [Klebsiella pneumoniae]